MIHYSPRTVSCIGFPVTTNPSASSASHCHRPSSSRRTLSTYKLPPASTRNRCPTTLLLYVLSISTVCTICPSLSQTLELKFMLTEHSSTSFTFCLEYNCTRSWGADGGDGVTPSPDVASARIERRCWEPPECG